MINSKFSDEDACVNVRFIAGSNTYKKSLNVFPCAFKKYHKFNCLLLVTMGLVPKSSSPSFSHKWVALHQSGWNTSHCVPSPLFTSTVEVGSEGKNPLESPLSVWPVNPRFMSPVLTPPQKSVGINIHYHQNWVHEISDTWFWGKYEILQTKKALVMTDKRAPCIICCMRPEKARQDR